MSTPAEFLQMGYQHHQQGNLEQAECCYREVLHADPQNSEALSLLGGICLQQGRLEEALGSFRTVLAFHPGSAETCMNLGNVLVVSGNEMEAEAMFRQAVALRPDWALAHFHLGNTLSRRHRLEEAVACYRRALQLQPADPQALNNLGTVLEELNRPDEAAACHDEALRLWPDYAPAHLARASARLRSGDFPQGWPEYEWRRRIPQFAVPPLPTSQPVWDGSPLVGRRILVRAELGLGDTLQFIRYARLLHQRGGHVIVEAQTPLLSLLKTCAGIDDLVGRGEPLPEFDVHTWLLSLPGLLGTDLSSIPAVVPYLWADPALVESWRKELSAFSGFKVGIVWQGNPRFPMDYLRSIPLTNFAPLGQVEGVHLFSLQKQHGTEQLANLGDRFAVTDLRPSFADAAAVIKNLDLVVTSNTAMAHLAGALGTPVWVLLSSNPDWRWLLDRQDSPWYPTMRLFRQEWPGDWTGVVERVAREIRRRVRGLS